MTQLLKQYKEKQNLMQRCREPYTRIKTRRHGRDWRRVLCAGLLLWLSAAGASETEASATWWFAPGFQSWHPNRAAGYRENNIGVSLEADLHPEVALLAGNFINSDRARSRYLGAAWLPLELGPLRLGAYAGGFDGYPMMRAGGWFAAAMPLLTWRGERWGLNFSAVPNYRNRLHGAVIGQVLLRFW